MTVSSLTASSYSRTTPLSITRAAYSSGNAASPCTRAGKTPTPTSLPARPKIIPPWSAVPPRVPRIHSEVPSPSTKSASGISRRGTNP